MKKEAKNLAYDLLAKIGFQMVFAPKLVLLPEGSNMGAPVPFENQFFKTKISNADKSAYSSFAKEIR